MTMTADKRGQTSKGRQIGTTRERGLFFFFLLAGHDGEKTHRSPGQLAEHLDSARALLNWRQRGGRRADPEEVLERNGDGREGFVKIVMPTFLERLGSFPPG